mgnify:CR=1 FL=1
MYSTVMRKCRQRRLRQCGNACWEVVVMWWEVDEMNKCLNPKQTHLQQIITLSTHHPPLNYIFNSILLSKLNFNNGLYYIDVVIQGQGIPLNLDLKDPDQGFTNLGIVSVG